MGVVQIAKMAEWLQMQGHTAEEVIECIRYIAGRSAEEVIEKGPVPSPQSKTTDPDRE